MKKLSLMLLIMVLSSAACGKKADSMPEQSQSINQSENVTAAAASSEEEPLESIAVSLQDIAKDPKGFIAVMDEYMRAGDVRILDYFVFDDSEEEAAVRAILKDETARELWCAAYAPTSWYIDYDSAKNTIRLGSKTPRWMYIDNIHVLLTDCKPYTNTPEDMLGYFADYADDIPIVYDIFSYDLAEGDMFEMNGSIFFKKYMTFSKIEEAISNPVQPFTTLMAVYNYTTELPSELTAVEQAEMEYYQMVIDNRFLEADEYAQNSSVLEQEVIFIYEAALEVYEAMSEEEKAEVLSEVDKIPTGSIYQYSSVKKSDKSLRLKGFAITYEPVYGSNFEIFEEGLPIYRKKINLLHLVDRNEVSTDNLEGFVNCIYYIDRLHNN